MPPGRAHRAPHGVSHHVAELLNRAVNPQAPYVGSSAFAHKAGLHTSAIARAKDAYEHVDPEQVGNGTRFVVSEMAGRATITMKAAELGLAMDGPAVTTVIDDLKRLEHEGYHFEAADASLELLMRRAAGWEQDFFRVESMRVITDELPNGEFSTEATVKVWVGDDRRVFTAEGNGPVNAIDTALRSALNGAYPELDRVHLTDYKVRILDGAGATGAVTRVLLDATDGERDWTTIGVSANIIEASWRALEESLVYGLLHASGVTSWAAMAAPRFAPVTPLDDARGYESPDHVPGPWVADRPADIAGRQPAGPRLGYQGPDQGYALTLAARIRPELHVQPGEHVDDALAGCTAVALRRASMYGRAPVIHDLRIACTIWGFLDPSPPAELVDAAPPAVRRRRQHAAPLRRAAGARRLGPRGDAAPHSRRGRRGVPVAVARPARTLTWFSPGTVGGWPPEPCPGRSRSRSVRAAMRAAAGTRPASGTRPTAGAAPPPAPATAGARPPPAPPPAPACRRASTSPSSRMA